MQIALDNGTVHERARVAFVRIADDVFPVRLLIMSGLPFDAGGESGPATAPEAGRFDDVDDRLRRCGQRPGERLVAVAGDVCVEGRIIHRAAVAEGDLHLGGKEVDVRKLRHIIFAARVVIGVFLHYLAADEVTLHDIGNFFRSHGGVENIARPHQQDRPDGAQSHAPGCDDSGLSCQTRGFESGHEGVPNRHAAGGHAASATADQDFAGNAAAFLS